MQVIHKKRTRFIAPLVFFAAFAAYAKEYGSYDPKRILIASETPAGKQFSVDVRYLDQWLNNLSLHAKDYPAQFDTPLDRQRAAQDVRMLSGALDTLITGPTPNPQLLARAAFLNSLGHNLDITGLGEKADAIYKKLLTAAPADPRANYMYGSFLAGAGKSTEAITYLETPLAVGVADANYTLGIVYMTFGDKDKALQYLAAYQRQNPNDETAGQMLDAVRNGNVQFKRMPAVTREP